MTTTNNTPRSLPSASAMSAALRRGGFNPSWKGGKRVAGQGLSVTAYKLGRERQVRIRADWDDPATVARALTDVAEWLAGAGFAFERAGDFVWEPEDGSAPVVFVGGRSITVTGYAPQD